MNFLKSENFYLNYFLRNEKDDISNDFFIVLKLKAFSVLIESNIAFCLVNNESLKIQWRSCNWYRSSHQKCSMKKGVLENFLEFTGKHLWQSLFFNKVAGLVQVFSCEFCKISRNTSFTEHLRTTASVGRKNYFNVLVNWVAVPGAFSNRKSNLAVERNAPRSIFNHKIMIKQFPNTGFCNFIKIFLSILEIPILIFPDTFQNS